MVKRFTLGNCLFGAVKLTNNAASSLWLPLLHSLFSLFIVAPNNMNICLYIKIVNHFIMKKHPLTTTN